MQALEAKFASSKEAKKKTLKTHKTWRMSSICSNMLSKSFFNISVTRKTNNPHPVFLDQ